MASVFSSLGATRHQFYFCGLAVRKRFVVKEVGLELADPLAVAVVVVLGHGHSFVVLLADDEASVEGAQLSGDDVPFGADFCGVGYEEQAGEDEQEGDVGGAELVPDGRGGVSDCADEGEQEDADHEDVGCHDEHVVAYLGVADEGDQVQGVDDLQDHQQHAHHLDLPEPHCEGHHHQPPHPHSHQHVVLRVPPLRSHLLQQHVVVRVLDLEPLPVAGHPHPHHHQSPHHHSQHPQHEGHHVGGALRSDLHEAAVEEHVEDEGDDTDREDNLLAADEEGCGVVRNAIHQDQQYPEHPQHAHHHDELDAEGVSETVVAGQAQVDCLHDVGATLKAALPSQQRGQLQVLVDVAVDRQAHEQHEQLQQDHCDGDNDEGEGGGRGGGLAPREVRGVVGAATGGVGCAVGGALGQNKRKQQTDYNPLIH